MHLLHLPLPLPFSHLRPPRPLSSSSSEGSLPPARDRVIDFGRHRGRRLGSLPSSYLRWVSSTLRARRSEPWALLADQVLRDPLYRDRIEWEHAARLLSGDAPFKPRSPSPSSSGVDVVSELLGIAERFGWDNDDREGWARVDFELLGTSFGGRIPRIRRGSDSGGEKGRKVGSLGEVEEEADEVVRGKREERRERRRRRVKREKQEEEGDRNSSSSSSSNGFVKEKRKECLLGNENKSLYNPFPGRGALLEKIKRRGG